MHQIKKQALLKKPLEKDVLKLARVLYNTCIEDNYEFCLEVPIKTLIRVMKLEDEENPIKHLKYLFEELNEPLCVENFKFYRTTYKMRFIYFCTYSFRDEYLDIELSEEYLFAIENYMIEPYL